MKRLIAIKRSGSNAFLKAMPVDSTEKVATTGSAVKI